MLRQLRCLIALGVAAITGVGLAGCARGDLKSTESYCIALADRQLVLSTPPTDIAGITAIIAATEQMANRAPLAVDDQWITLLAVLRQASVANLDDTTVTDALALQTAAATNAANDIWLHARTSCDIALPEVPPLIGGPQLPSPPPGTTLPPLTVAIATTEPPTTVPPIIETITEESVTPVETSAGLEPVASAPPTETTTVP